MTEFKTIPEYPAKIESLSLSDLEKLNRKYHQENNDKYCSTLNEYGFTGFSRVLFPGDVNPCLSKTPVRIELTNTDTLITAVKRDLLKNSRYTSVVDTSLLDIEELLPLYGCTICEGPNTNSVPIEWKITFKPQVKDGTEIRNTRISVFIDAQGVNRIWGNWYPEFRVPGLINYGYAYAKETLVGRRIQLNQFIGIKGIFTIAEEHLTERPEYEFLPFESEGTLELRKTWKVIINYPGDELEGWVANVDVFDGELLQIELIETGDESSDKVFYGM